MTSFTSFYYHRIIFTFFQIISIDIIKRGDEDSSMHKQVYSKREKKQSWLILSRWLHISPFSSIGVTSHQMAFRVINREVTKFRAKMNNIHIFPISVVTPFLIWQLTMPAASLRNKSMTIFPTVRATYIRYLYAWEITMACMWLFT